MRLVRARLAGLADVSARVKAFRFRCEDPSFSYLPGQWLDLYVSGIEKCGGYSFTSSPQERGGFELIVLRNLKHPVTAFLHERIRVGDEVTVSCGQGDFILPVDLRAPVLLIAGGIGITPLISMARTLGLGRDRFALIHSARTADDFILKGELEKLAGERFRYLPFLSAGGRVGEKDLRPVVEWLGPALQAFVCGPGTMNADVSGTLGSLGVAAERIQAEKWW